MLRRHPRPFAYVLATLAFALILFAAHGPYLSLPYFWDELGQFVPAALDLFRGGSLVPHSAIPNVHPPGVMAWLAAAWSAAGYSIVATRSAMLVLASFGLLCAFLLSIELFRGLPGAPAFLALLPLLEDPLFFTQSMMAQLDMPAMVFSLAGLLLFLQNRHVAAAAACCALVMSKETGIVLPLVLGLSLTLRKRQRIQAAWYAAPFLLLACWLALLWRTTGTPFGDPAFARYNTVYALHPVRLGAAFLRRFYYLFAADLRWVGCIAIVYGWRRGVFAHVGWKVVGAFAAFHVMEVTVLGGAELERYLLPVVPLFYMACAAGWTSFAPLWRNVSVAALCLGLLAGLAINPPYPFPFENNLAMADFVALHKAAAEYLEQTYPGESVHTAWPLTAALRTPEFGYVHRAMKTVETSDLHFSTLNKLDPGKVQVLAMYSRTQEDGWIMSNAWVREFLARYFDYERQMTSIECRRKFGLFSVMRWTRRGQWIEIYARDLRPPPAALARLPFSGAIR